MARQALLKLEQMNHSKETNSKKSSSGKSTENMALLSEKQQEAKSYDDDELVYTQKKRVDDAKHDDCNVPGEKDPISYVTDEDENMNYDDPLRKI